MARQPGHIRRRGRGSWEISIYQGRIGRRRIYYTETYRGTETGAERRRLDLLEMAADDRLPDRADLTVAHLAEEWLEHKRDQGKAPNTLRNYRSIIDLHLVPTLGTVKVRRLDVFAIERAYRQIRKGETGRSAQGAGSMRTIHAVTSGMCKLAKRYGWMTDNPAPLVELEPRPKTELDLPEVADLLALAERVGRQDPDRRTFVLLAVATGARRGELCGVRWRDLDLEAGTWHLCNQRARGDAADADAPAWADRLPKGGKVRDLALDADTVRELKACRVRSIERALACGITLDPAAYVFTRSVDGLEPWIPGWCGDWWRRAARALELDHRLHDVRHLRATDLAEVAPAAVVQANLGHAHLATTERYLHVRKGADRTAVEELAARRRKAGGR
jgi:integrase